MRRTASVALVFVLMLVAGAATAASGEKTVKTLGGDSWKTNVAVNSNHRFSPGKTSVSSGDTLNFVNADTQGAPRAVSIVDRADLPDSSESLIFGCPLCEAVEGEHFPPMAPPVGIVDPGGDGFNEVGDSVFFFPSNIPGPPGFPVDSFSVEVTAPAGTTLSYFCALHPWMQGTIEVRG